ncbi:MAG: hypothetical protein ACR2RV_25475, partial [Verrucomicrobiales bacterium]
YKTDPSGAYIVKTEDRKFVPRQGELEKVKAGLSAEESLVDVGVRNWHLPSFKEKSTTPALLLALFGAALVILIEWLGAKFGRGRSSS